ncbi:FecR domain-containing protein [uncultured Sphingomonas sp.]|uniref:FecR family protein n=1 Tax=uncultured Sphingomonas sp. TaxID=158754 RepID=UPI0035CA733E
MSGPIADHIMAQAIDWHIRSGEMGEAEWVAFVDWLEADPANARAYDRVAADDRAMPAIAAPLAPPAARPLLPRRWAFGVGGTAIAAGLVALLVPAMLPRAAMPYSVVTRPGEQRTIALADGTRIDLDGATRLDLDRTKPRSVSLAAGEAVFHVRHDAADPFTVRSGALTLRDIGTVFDVTRAGKRLDIAVAEGSVMFQPGRDALTLVAGRRLSADEGLGSVTLAAVEPAAVGGWRDGRMAFAGEPLSSVFAAIGRRYATDVRLAPGLSDRPFTGMIALSGGAGRDIPHLAALIGATWRRDGERWIITPGAAPTN